MNGTEGLTQKQIKKATKLKADKDFFLGLGFTSSEGYTFERSRALRGNQWCGLVIDLDNQSDQAKKKIKDWCEQVKKEFA